MSKPERFKIYIAGYLLLFKDQQILLSRRANSSYLDGCYSLPAGHFDGGETAEQCVAREAKEEINIDIKLADLKVVYVSHRLSPDREYIDVFLKADNWTGEINNNEPDKCDDLLWCDVKALPEKIVPEVREAINTIVNNKNKFYGEFGW